MFSVTLEMQREGNVWKNECETVDSFCTIDQVRNCAEDKFLIKF